MKSDGNERCVGCNVQRKFHRYGCESWLGRCRNGFDVAAFAKVNGGGGHTAAAGFHVAGRDEMGRGFKLLDPYHEVSSRLREFLRK